MTAIEKAVPRDAAAGARYAAGADGPSRQRERPPHGFMSETSLTPDRILDAAEETLTRFGPAKTTVVDVARALGVSHGSVYRHFASKAALRDAVTGALAGPRLRAAGRRSSPRTAPAPERLGAGSTG